MQFHIDYVLLKKNQYSCDKKRVRGQNPNPKMWDSLELKL
jgi:hypothetical protein